MYRIGMDRKKGYESLYLIRAPSSLIALNSRSGKDGFPWSMLLFNHSGQVSKCLSVGIDAIPTDELGQIVFSPESLPQPLSKEIDNDND